MASMEEKISALTNLMVCGVLTADEFTRVVAALNGASFAQPAPPPREISPAEAAYENYIMNVVANAFKSPSAVKFPPFDPSMVKEGMIKLDFSQVYCRYIETFVDAPNSYGTMLREPIILGIDDYFNILWWAQHVTVSPLVGKSKGWIRMTK